MPEKFEDYLDERNKLPPQMLADMRSVYAGGMAKGRSPGTDALIDKLKFKPNDFLEEMQGLEKAYQAQIAAAHRAGASKTTASLASPLPTDVLVPQPDAAEVSVLGLIQELLDKANQEAKE